MKRFYGLRLKRSVLNRYGTYIIPEETVFEEKHLRILENHGVRLSTKDFYGEDADVDAEDEPTHTDEEQESLHKIRQQIDQATLQVKQLFELTRFDKSVHLKEFRYNVVPAVKEIASSQDSLRLIHALKAKDDYTYRHNIAVGVLATKIGMWLDLDENELSLLTLGATLHDVGKMKIPNDILHKPDMLRKHEFEEMKKHTVYGYEILNQTVGVSHRCALIALQHHERESGSGYPFGLKGHKIDRLSKITAVADVFHAMISDKVYKKAKPFYQAMNELKERAKEFDATVLQTFMQKIMQASVGSEVMLSDGRVGNLVMINRQDLFKPLVKVGDEFVDLSGQHDVALEHVQS